MYEFEKIMPKLDTNLGDYIFTRSYNHDCCIFLCFRHFHRGRRLLTSSKFVPICELLYFTDIRCIATRSMLCVIRIGSVTGGGRGAYTYARSQFGQMGMRKPHTSSPAGVDVLETVYVQICTV